VDAVERGAALPSGGDEVEPSFPTERPVVQNGRMSGRPSFPFVIAALALFLAGGCGAPDPARDPDARGTDAGPHFGDRMTLIGLRFERLGRAGVARRWDFARYEVEELRESFEEIQRMPPPEELEGADMPRLIEALVESTFHGLDSALARRDSTAFRTAFGRAAARCNACHLAAKHAYIVIPAEPGAGVPVLTRAHEAR
jgi:hypothetical protein